MDLVSPPAWAPPWLNALSFAAGCIVAVAYLCLPFAMLGMAARLRRIESALRPHDRRPDPSPGRSGAGRRRAEPSFD